MQRCSSLVLVDDDPAMVRLIATAFEMSLGRELQCETTCSSEAARQRVMSEVVDILVTDLDMPELNGLELLRLAKHRNASTQVIVITGHSSREALLEAMEAGASDYLVKPLRTQEVLEVVREAHRRAERWRTALVATLHREPADSF